MEEQRFRKLALPPPLPVSPLPNERVTRESRGPLPGLPVFLVARTLPGNPKKKHHFPQPTSLAYLLLIPLSFPRV